MAIKQSAILCRALFLVHDLQAHRDHLSSSLYTQPCVLSRDVLLASVFEAAGVEGGAHALGHTMVTEALEAGGPVQVVRRMAGHAAVQITLGHYAHVRDQALRDAAGALAKRRRG